MHNMIYLIGRLTDNIKVEDKGEKKLAIASIAVQRAFKNEEGIYDTDFFDITLWDSIALNTAEYVGKGDLIGIKGRVQSNVYETIDGIKYHGLDIIAEKVSFLSSKKN